MIFKFPTLRKIWNLTQNDPKFEIRYLTRNFLFWLFDYFEAWFKSRNWPISRKIVTNVLKGYIFLRKKIEKKTILKISGIWPGSRSQSRSRPGIQIPGSKIGRDPDPVPVPTPAQQYPSSKISSVPSTQRERPLILQSQNRSRAEPKS